MTDSKTRRHFISLNDISDGDLHDIVARAALYSEGRIDGVAVLRELMIGIYFRTTSTRTRTSFSSAALRMGAQIVSYGPNDLQENTGESIGDTARVLSGMLDGFVARTAGTMAEMRQFAAQKRMSVINAMTEDEHPTQAIADLATLKSKLGGLEGLRVLYVGEGNNTAVALALSLPRFSGSQLWIYTPERYGIIPAVEFKAHEYSRNNKSNVWHFHDAKFLPTEVDVVYTTRWQTTGTSKPDRNWRTDFAKFSVTEDFMSKYGKALFMHDLPAHRGEEVDEKVLDGKLSIAFDQAENKLHAAKAVLEWALR